MKNKTKKYPIRAWVTNRFQLMFRKTYNDSYHLLVKYGKLSGKMDRLERDSVDIKTINKTSRELWAIVAKLIVLWEPYSHIIGRCKICSSVLVPCANEKGKEGFACMNDGCSTFMAI